MLDQIKKTITTRYKLDDTKGVFLSVFDKAWNLLTSQGVLHTDKALEGVIEKLYKGFAEDMIKNIQQSEIEKYGQQIAQNFDRYFVRPYAQKRT